jgi:hypothetical protein
MRLEFEKNYDETLCTGYASRFGGKTNEAQLATDDATVKFVRLTWPLTSANADFCASSQDSKAIEWLQLLSRLATSACHMSCATRGLQCYE